MKRSVLHTDSIGEDRKVKVVIATPIIFDRTSPFNHLLRDILEGLLDAGYEVTRIVAVERADDMDYQMGLNRITYIPVARKRSEKANIIKRYLLDTLTNIKMAKLLKKTNADVLFEDVSYSSFWSVRAAQKAGMRVVSMLQDVWPDNAVRSGLIKAQSLIYGYFEYWQRKVYKQSDRLICISDDMKSFITSKGVAKEKITVIYNWGYTDDIVDILWEENEFVKKYQLSKDFFYAIYAGNIGRMQNVELILKVAEQLKEIAKIKFLIVGDGVCREVIQQMAEEMKQTNLTFLPMQPSELATSIYSAAGVNIIPLIPDGIKTALPSKTGICLSCGRPVVFCFGRNTEFSQIVARHNAGLCIDSNDADGLKNAVLYCFHSSPRTDNIRAMYLSMFCRHKNVSQYTATIQATGEQTVSV